MTDYSCHCISVLVCKPFTAISISPRRTVGDVLFGDVWVSSTGISRMHCKSVKAATLPLGRFTLFQLSILGIPQFRRLHRQLYSTFVTSWLAHHDECMLRGMSQMQH